MTGPPRHGPTRPPIPHHPSCAPPIDIVARLRSMADTYRHAELGYIEPSLLVRLADEIETLRSNVDLTELERDIFDAAIAETRAEQEAVRRTTSALDAPNRSPALTNANNAQRAVTAARAARRDAVRQLLQHRQDQV